MKNLYNQLNIQKKVVEKSPLGYRGEGGLIVGHGLECFFDGF